MGSNGDSNREQGGTDKGTGSQVNDAYCPTCNVWYNTSRDDQVIAHAGH
jgi:hypothetical protein